MRELKESLNEYQLNMKMSRLLDSKRILNRLSDAGINTVGDLLSFNYRDYDVELAIDCACRGLAYKSIAEIVFVVVEYLDCFGVKIPEKYRAIALAHKHIRDWIQ